MDDLEKEPEEIPMEEVLSEIRQMLSSDMDATPSDRVEPTLSVSDSTPSPVEKEEVTSQESHTPVLPEQPLKQEAVLTPKQNPVYAEQDYFLLTPAMRCDLPPDRELSAQVKVQTRRVLDKLQQTSPVSQLSPALEDWLNKNLPAIVEKVLEEKLRPQV